VTHAGLRKADSSLHHWIRGSSRQAIIMISGLSGLADFWLPVAAALESSYTVISFDHPGVGKSPTTNAHSISGIADGVCGLLDDLDIEKAHIVGHSTGTLIAQALALDHPSRVDHIVMSGGWTRSDRRMRDLFAVRRSVLETMGLPAYKALSALLAYPPDWYQQHIAQHHEPALHADASDTTSISARIQMLLSFDRMDELHKIQSPVLVVGATDDQVIPLYLAQELARAIPRAQFLQLSGGHLFPLVRTEDYVAAVRNHLEKRS
jgi:aminoacrylate hydrolase